MDIVTRIPIERAKHTAWNVLSDLRSWNAWNPALTNVDMEAFEPGGSVRFDLRFAPTLFGKSRIHCAMVWVRPGEGFAWTGPQNAVLRRLVRGEHWFLLEETGAQSCIFHHGETFTGRLSGAFETLAHARIQRVYEGVNRAFKRRVESF